jgi:hypothetical protein
MENGLTVRREIDFVRLGVLLNEIVPSASFIAEMCQDSKNEGKNYG